MIEKNPGIYQMYKDKMKTMEEYEQKLQLDIPRTFPDHPRFGEEGSDTESVKNVLLAYAEFNPIIGYCQGMTFIVAVLLMHMNEENTFWVLVQIMKKYELSSFFTNCSTEPPAITKFDRIFKACLPNLDLHMKDQGCSPSVFATQWMRTLFSHEFDLPVVFRIWDLFFVQKLDFLINFIVAIFLYDEDKILSMQSSEMLIYVKSLPTRWQSKFDDLLRLSVKSHTSFVNIVSVKNLKQW
eukprot:TRINITY_DN2666_c0_g1_i1.p1 TRINITY_DN2666_c0_g1~~TRINITY_DN2666_c0_g1_i1.p1  ORF type:complete len:239 (+),score=29.37 TRINITY_DN2666_c0_g1_i1:683-1399(+)